MNAPTRERLGSWQFQSGNSVDAYFWRDAEGREHLSFEWTWPPPVCRSDRRFYERVVRPAAIRRFQEFVERPGRVAVVEI